MDQIREMLNRIEELTADEIDTLENSIVTEFDSAVAQDLTREVAGQMKELGDAAEAIRTERSRRDQEAAELAEMRDAAAARIRGESADADTDESVEEVEDEKKAEKPASEPEFAVSDSTEVVAPVETTTEATVVASAEELAVEQPAVQPEEIKENPEVGQTDAEIHAKNLENGLLESDPDILKSDDVSSDAEQAEKVEAAKEADVPVPVTVAEAKANNSETESDSEETVTAAANTSGLVVEVPEDRGLQSPKAAAAPVVITAGADIPGVPAGTQLTSMRQVAQAFIDRRKGMSRTTGGDGEQNILASFATAFPEDRVLRSNDLEGNSTKVKNVASQTAITAAGGLCAPVEVRYDVFGFDEELGRPVRDSLAVFAADRGGIRFVTPPTLSDLDGAVSLWTLTDDINAATAGAPDPVKPCIRVDCGDEVVVYTDAIPLCLTFGNMGARAYPELVERHLQLGMVSHARYAETRLLTRIGALSTAVTAAAQLGAARDFFVQVEAAAAGYRSRYRISPDANLRVILPEWFKNALRADLTKQIPGDGQSVTFNLSEADINGWFASRNINVTWALDGETGQIFGTQAVGALNGFPTNVIWYLFSEGTFLFLDGGTLDLGLVRDSTLNGTNDYKIFLETFEGVAKVGIESLRVTSQLRIAGASAATVATI